MRILVIRTSAMGDVALLAPVIRALRSEYPEADISLLTRRAFNPFFSSVSNLEIINPDFNGSHKGPLGLIRLCNELLKSTKPELVIDLHDVIRTRVLRFLFRIRGVPVFVIEKGRREKRNLIKGRSKIRLKHSIERYSETFRKAGIHIEPLKEKSIFASGKDVNKATHIMAGKSLVNIGIAPFAMHSLKEWPESFMIKLLHLIYHRTPCNFWFFGGRDERSRLEKLSNGIPNSNILAGDYTLDEELAIMARLDLMIAMDSSNMHMAALLGTRVISIWGGTDPLAGFGPWMQPDDSMIRIPVEELTCRPCTIYGKGKCRRGDFACMNWLTPERVLDKIINLETI